MTTIHRKTLPTYDRPAAIERMKNGSVDSEIAEAAADAIAQVVARPRYNAVTKDDIREVRFSLIKWMWD